MSEHVHERAGALSLETAETPDGAEQELVRTGEEEVDEAAKP